MYTIVCIERIKSETNAYTLLLFTISSLCHVDNNYHCHIDIHCQVHTHCHVDTNGHLATHCQVDTVT